MESSASLNQNKPQAKLLHESYYGRDLAYKCLFVSGDVFISFIASGNMT